MLNELEGITAENVMLIVILKKYIAKEKAKRKKMILFN